MFCNRVASSVSRFRSDNFGLPVQSRVRSFRPLCCTALATVPSFANRAPPLRQRSASVFHNQLLIEPGVAIDDAASVGP
jgi:hypothetical protein